MCMCVNVLFWKFSSKNLPAYWATGISKPLAIHAAASCYGDCSEPFAKAHLKLWLSWLIHRFMIMVFISEQCVFHHAIADKRERVCHYVLARRSVKPVIWPFGPLVRHAKHSRNISLKWTSSDGYYIIWCRSPAPTKRRIIVPTEKEDNTTLACAGPKSSHHLWQRWWGRDCRSPEFVCWTWSPARTTEMTSQRMPQWKRSLIKFCFVFLYPLLHNLYSCDVLFLSKHSSVHLGV